MGRTSRPRRLAAVIGTCLVAAVTGVAPSSSSAAQPEPPAPPPELSGPSDGELGPITEPIKEGPARLDSSLLAASTVSVTVEILHEPDPLVADALAQTVHSLGGSVTGSVPGFLVQADVPVVALVELAASPGVRQVRPPLDAAMVPGLDPALFESDPAAADERVGAEWLPGAASQATPGSVVGEHLAHLGAPAWHAAGWTGAGIKVGIVDTFSAEVWATAQASGNVPSPAGVLCRFKGADCGSPFVGATATHGNSVAEIIHDLVPDAALYIAFAYTASDLQAAVDWFHANGVQVISRSLGSFLDGPGNGGGALNAVAASAVSRGIPFINSAGNHANRGGRPGGYWRSGWVDADGDGWLDFQGPNNELMRITCGGFFQGFRWSDWGANPTDYDVYVFSETNNTTPVWALDEAQVTGVAPLEGVDESESQWCTTPIRRIGVRLFAPGSGTSGDQLEIFMNLASVQYPQTPFSAGQPIADSATRGVVSVGAVDPVGGNTIGAYSSAGPTNDGRIKPDISAASGISTTAHPSRGFTGTSAAAPVAAGIAALYLDAGLASTPAQVHDLLVNRAVDLGAAGADYDFGYGEVRLGAVPAAPPPPPPVNPNTGAFVSLPPVRVLDTRSGNGAAPGLLGPGSVVDVQVTGRGGVPATGVLAVALNVTITEAVGPGFVQALPSGQGVLGSSSNLNAEFAGQTIPNAVIVPVGAGGRVSLYTQSGGHLLADVLGYFVPAATSAAGRFQDLAPSRLLDTRTGLGSAVGVDPLAGGASMPLQVTGRGGVPSSGVSAVALNVTATFAQGAGFVQVVPTGGPTGLGASSNLNVLAGQTIPNLVIVPVGAGGTVTLYSSTTTHLIADVVGWFTDGAAPVVSAGLFLPRAPVRYFDTRENGGLPLAPGGVFLVCTAADVRGAVFNVTATETEGPGFVQVVPANVVALGSTSNLNIEFFDQTIPNAVVTGTGSDARCPGGGAIYNYTHAGTHLLADVFGVFVT